MNSGSFCTGAPITQQRGIAITQQRGIAISKRQRLASQISSTQLPGDDARAMGQ
jgi:hypothetical protein